MKSYWLGWVGLYSYRLGNYCVEKMLGVFSNANSPDILKRFHSMVLCKKILQTFVTVMFTICSSLSRWLESLHIVAIEYPDV